MGWPDHHWRAVKICRQMNFDGEDNERSSHLFQILYTELNAPTLANSGLAPFYFFYFNATVSLTFAAVVVERPLYIYWIIDNDSEIGKEGGGNLLSSHSHRSS